MNTIVNTKFCVVKEAEGKAKLRVFIALSDGGWIEHQEFDNNLQGLVAALDLATQCCAGKFYPKKVVTREEVTGVGLLTERVYRLGKKP
jgi:hypothetical protein